MADLHARVRIIVLLTCLALVAAACGQKEGVHQGRQVGFSGGQAAGGGEEVFEDTGDFDDEAAFADEVDFEDVEGNDFGGDDQGADFAGGGDTSGADAGTTAGGDAGAGEDGAAAPGGDDGGGGGGGETDGGAEGGGGETAGGGGGETGGAASTGGDTRGTSDDQIRIGVHAPLTGAAPIPQTSVEKARQQYWDVHGKIHGREVEVIIRDDQYNPSRATSVCNELIQRQEVFLLAGVGGVDQIAACARTAAQQGVPYISAGTVEGALRRLPNYFAVSMSYKQQAALVMQWVQKNSPPSNGKFAIVRDRTPNFGEVVEEMGRLAQAAGYEVLVHQFSNAPSTGQWLAQNGIEVAFPIMAPSAWVQIVNSPGGRIKQWVGVGPTAGLNSVASAGCPSIDGAMFFSSWSGLNQADKLDRDFNGRGGGGDDIQWASWGQNKALAVVFEGIGRNLTREAFIQYLQTNEVKTGITPALRHSKDNNFGVSEQHYLIADCGKREFVTPDEGLFVRAR
jgi:branched-chain amino acid transport system substrate-binding protein